MNNQSVIRSAKGFKNSDANVTVCPVMKISSNWIRLLAWAITLPLLSCCTNKGFGQETSSISSAGKATFSLVDVDFANPVYETDFQSQNELQDWCLEGGLRMEIEDGNLVLESRRAVDNNHLVCWLKQEMPADFLLEFTVSPENRDRGLNIVFFNARGIRGENIFDPPLKPRDGTFVQYHSGDLNNYHCSYWAGNRGFSNLRKNKGFHLVAEGGQDKILHGEEGTFQTVRVYKKGGMIRVLVDDVVIIAWDDDGKTYGPVYKHSGWIGLRQMGHTIRCRYGRFAVYPLK